MQGPLPEGSADYGRVSVSFVLDVLTLSLVTSDFGGESEVDC